MCPGSHAFCSTRFLSFAAKALKFSREIGHFLAFLYDLNLVLTYLKEDGFKTN
jgi:hypothetical protein